MDKEHLPDLGDFEDLDDSPRTSYRNPYVIMDIIKESITGLYKHRARVAERFRKAEIAEDEWEKYKKDWNKRFQKERMGIIKEYGSKWGIAFDIYYKSCVCKIIEKGIRNLRNERSGENTKRINEYQKLLDGINIP